MLLRTQRRRLGANLTAGIFQASPPTPGTFASQLGVTAAPLGSSPRPLFMPGPTTVDYAFPTVPPVPTAAGSVAQAMQPMGGGAGGSSGGGDPNMPEQMPLHGVPPSLAPFPDSTYQLPTPPPAVDAGPIPLALAAMTPPGLVNLLNPFDPQRSPAAIAGVVGGGVLLVVLLLRR